MKKKHNFIRAAAFVVLTLSVLAFVGRAISSLAVNDHMFWRLSGFYLEKKESLDAVIVGPSATYAYWEPTTAWEEYGIAVYPYSTAQQPLASTRFIIEECRKTQPDALFVININLFLMEGITSAQIHFLSDIMPPSLNRHRMIQYMAEKGEYDSPYQLLEFYQPVFAMHSRWKRAHLPSKHVSGFGCKGASLDPQFIKGSEDVTGLFGENEERLPITEDAVYELDLLFDYIEENDVNACFFYSPAVVSNDVIPYMNTLIDYIRDAGYTLYDGAANFEETGLYPPTDYMDRSHTNIHGAIKFTRWLGGKLVEDYGFEDKRGHPDYASWDESVEHYDRIVRIVSFQ